MARDNTEGTVLAPWLLWAGAGLSFIGQFLPAATVSVDASDPTTGETGTYVESISFWDVRPGRWWLLLFCVGLAAAGVTLWNSKERSQRTRESILSIVGALFLLGVTLNRYTDLSDAATTLSGSGTLLGFDYELDISMGIGLVLCMLGGMLCLAGAVIGLTMKGEDSSSKVQPTISFGTGMPASAPAGELDYFGNKVTPAAAPARSVPQTPAYPQAPGFGQTQVYPPAPVYPPPSAYPPAPNPAAPVYPPVYPPAQANPQAPPPAPPPPPV